MPQSWPFKNENIAQKLPKNAKFQAGVSNYDPPGRPVEQGITLPWASLGEASWVYYDVTLLNVLDSGIVVHRTLPQYDRTADTLASCDITDPTIDRLTGRGVNTISNDKFTDIVQRMGHSRYWFRLFGQAMRIGYQVPIPGIKRVADVKAIPHDENPQWAYNKIVGNYSGAPLWHAQWSLWYTVAEPPKAQQTPPQNVAVHIGGNVVLPKELQAPFSQPDDEAQNTRGPTPTFQNPLG